MSSLWLSALVFTGIANAGTPRASSELRDEDGTRHSASMAFDGLLSTGWAEAQSEAGEGEWLELNLGRSTVIESISIWPGNLSTGARSLREYGRPREVAVQLFSGTKEIAKQHVKLPDLVVVGPKRVDVKIAGKATKVRVKLLAVDPGHVFNQTYLSEVAVNFSKGDSPTSTQAVMTWQATASGERALEKHKALVIARFETLQAGDLDQDEASANEAKEIFADFVDWAGDGLPADRARVSRSVPMGFRIQALPSDPLSVQALLKLKDASGIPGLERAALRVKGRAQRTLQSQVSYFYAYQELIGGEQAFVDPWGGIGWAKGQLRGFGESINLDVDSSGQLLVADVGNHRVQRFSESGLANAQWGQTPAVEKAWFDTGRPFYVSGATSGTQDGQFVNPVDVAVFSEKDGDWFAVLDGAKRVQVFNPEGTVVYSWTLNSHQPLELGVGGQAFLVYTKGKLVAVWGDEGFSFSKEGEELSKWSIEGGAPSGAVGLKNGKVGLVFSDELVQFSVDGFRHGPILKQTLPSGFESMDVAIDQDGALWVVTDTGHALKYKRPGKVDYMVTLPEDNMNALRLAVHNDVLYVVDGEQIRRWDAAAMWAEANPEQ